jgi:hypothetical protein
MNSSFDKRTRTGLVRVECLLTSAQTASKVVQQQQQQLQQQQQQRLLTSAGFVPPAMPVTSMPAGQENSLSPPD